jgi:cytochrome c oxidase assembly protein subunit 15
LIFAGAVALQAVLGIVTLLHQAPLPLALTHQMVAILVFTIAVVHAERLWHREKTLAAKPLAAGAGA